MKKTLIALFAVAGIASGATIAPMTSTTGWNLDSNIEISDGELYAKELGNDANGQHINNVNWTVKYSSYSLGETVTLTTEDTLSFSFDITNYGTGNSMLTLALIGTTDAIVVGHGNYDKYNNEQDRGGDVQVGVTNNLTAQGYGFATTNPGDDVQLDALTNIVNGAPDNGTTTTISGLISWDGDSYSLALTTAAGDSTVDLGLTTLDLVSLGVTLEGGDDSYNSSTSWQTPTMSNLSVSYTQVPEPATASLSLLGLAALMIRRRR